MTNVELSDAVFFGALLVFWLCIAAAIAHGAKTAKDIVADLIGVGVAVWLAVTYAGAFAVWSGLAASAIVVIYVATFGLARSAEK